MSIESYSVALGYKSSEFHPKRSRSWSRLIVAFFTVIGSRRQMIEHGPNRQLRNHIIAVPPGLIYSQTSVVIWVDLYAFINGRSIADDGRRRADRHRDRIFVSIHWLIPKSRVSFISWMRIKEALQLNVEQGTRQSKNNKLNFCLWCTTLCWFEHNFSHLSF